MLFHSTCRDCGGSLLITNPDDTIHPLCKPQPTRLERLTQLWLIAVEGGSEEEAHLEAQINKLNNRPPRLREAALAYAGWGWPVFPLKPHAKTPATRNGFKDATTDPERITAWWTRHPDSNIGLPTGLAFDVIDIDIPDGPQSLAYILNSTVDKATGRGLLPDAHGVVATASGGAHYYTLPKGGGNKAAIMPGIDIRGAGGYVVAPPSTLGEPGRSWSWTVVPSPTIKSCADVVA